jgi:large subunit ribosomal protein L13
VQQKTYYPKAAEIQRDWVVINAEGQTLGRLAARIAHVLLGKHKPTPSRPAWRWVTLWWL